MMGLKTSLWIDDNDHGKHPFGSQPGMAQPKKKKKRKLGCEPTKNDDDDDDDDDDVKLSVFFGNCINQNCGIETTSNGNSLDKLDLK